MTTKISVWALPLSLIALAAVLAISQNVPNTFHLILAAVSCLLALGGTIRSCTAGLRPVAATFYVFWFGWLGVGPIAQLTMGQVAWGDATALADPGRITVAILLADAALVAFIIGEALSRSRDDLPKATKVDSRNDSPVRGWVLLLVVVALLAVAPRAISTFGGIQTYFSSRNERSAALLQSGLGIDAVGGAQFALVTTLPIALSVAGALLALYRIQGRWSGVSRVRVLDAIAFLTCLGGVVIFANPLSQTRFIAVTGFGCLIIAILHPRTRRAGGTYVAIALIGTLLIYPLANFFRGVTARSEELVTAETFTSNDFDGFQQVINTITYAGEIGHTWGLHIISAIGYVIPRAVWDGKAEPASLDVAASAGYSFVNLSMPIHAELFLEFGWIGTVVGMFLVGFFVARVDSAWLRTPESKLALMAPYMAVAMLGFIRGPLGSQVPIYLTVIVILVVGLRGNRRDSVPGPKVGGECPLRETNAQRAL